MPHTQLANLTGRPAISVPLHSTQSGLPSACRWSAASAPTGLLLQVAARAEQAQPWFHRYAELDPALGHHPGVSGWS
ncbi:MAG TPA: hypothetical protein VFI44_04025 [Ornithinibacter sp.]|nr:hypothetical protein [Ornithinibacter sp.]